MSTDKLLATTKKATGPAPLTSSAKPVYPFSPPLDRLDLDLLEKEGQIARPILGPVASAIGLHRRAQGWVSANRQQGMDIRGERSESPRRLTLKTLCSS